MSQPQAHVQPLQAREQAGGRLRRFLRARDGATAVEFAIIALPFTALIFGIIELGMIFMVTTTLDNATETMTRAIRTGAFQTAGSNSGDLKTKICGSLGWLQNDCPSNLYLDVRTYDQFADITQDAPVTNGAFDPSKIQFQVGTSGSIVVVRAYYLWTVFAPGVSSGLQTLSGGKTLIKATTAFRNEAYS